ncbi:hypothetical protein ACOMHN_049610 [Nucella lapillus]
MAFGAFSGFLLSLGGLRNSSIFDQKKLDNPTQLRVRPRAETWPPLSVQTLAITVSGLRMLNHTALLDLSMLLRALGEEGMSLEFRHMASYLILYSSHHLCEDLLHMASYLILYSSHHLCEDLLHQVILCLGYFTLLHLIIRHILKQELNCVLLANFIEDLFEFLEWSCSSALHSVLLHT